ncbi:hypothetical protein H9L15_12060 [Sphingomonas daechungensis]|uniref:Uncharacterized protein n=1 Tax=Sphingomonas daechungensis TaxID=1176646 RepID=A0ABX6T066_9SPHN|nr:hypothetical protein [Sphingomonas daechungensis]QNP42809.1 hypothetical protein H9L15_12060 [Sphingomonas daechungensis]
MVSIDGIPIGYLEDARHRASLQASFLELARFSGFPSTSSEVRAIEMGSVETSETLIDAWQTGDGRLRTRWSADGAGCIVRAYQHDPEKGGSLALLGEGLVIAATDFIDVNLRNPFFPLFLFWPILTALSAARKCLFFRRFVGRCAFSRAALASARSEQGNSKRHRHSWS